MWIFWHNVNEKVYHWCLLKRLWSIVIIDFIVVTNIAVTFVVRSFVHWIKAQYCCTGHIHDISPWQINKHRMTTSENSLTGNDTHWCGPSLRRWSSYLILLAHMQSCHISYYILPGHPNYLLFMELGVSFYVEYMYTLNKVVPSDRTKMAKSGPFLNPHVIQIGFWKSK